MNLVKYINLYYLSFRIAVARNMFNELKASESQHYLKQRIKVEGRKQRSYLKLMVHERFFWIDVT